MMYDCVSLIISMDEPKPLYSLLGEKTCVGYPYDIHFY